MVWEDPSTAMDRRSLKIHLHRCMCGQLRCVQNWRLLVVSKERDGSIDITIELWKACRDFCAGAPEIKIFGEQAVEKEGAGKDPEWFMKDGK